MVDDDASMLDGARVSRKAHVDERGRARKRALGRQRKGDDVARWMEKHGPRAGGMTLFSIRCSQYNKIPSSLYMSGNATHQYAIDCVFASFFLPQRRVTSPNPFTGPAAASNAMNKTTETIEEIELILLDFDFLGYELPSTLRDL